MPLNPDWNTPPGGDFAAYVERLTARSARAVFAPQRAPEFDDGSSVEARGIASPGGAPAPAVPAGRGFAPAFSPGSLSPERLFNRGLTAALGALREQLERGAASSRKK